jgi:Mg2+/Co2+ transporter CorB
MCEGGTGRGKFQDAEDAKVTQRAQKKKFKKFKKQKNKNENEFQKLTQKTQLLYSSLVLLLRNLFVLCVPEVGIQVFRYSNLQTLIPSR